MKFTVDPVVPRHLLPYSSDKRIMLRVIWVKDFEKVPAAFDQITNMRVIRIESMYGQFAVSKEKRL